MSISFHSLRAFKMDSSALEDVTEAALAPATIPDDIGVATKVSGFTTWSDMLPHTVLRVSDVIVLRHGTATKAITKRQISRAVQQRIADGAPDSQALKKEVKNELLSRMPQALTSYPIILDPASSLAVVAGATDRQIENARAELLGRIPDLGLLETTWNGWASHRLCSWIQSELPLPAHIQFGRHVRLVDCMRESVSIMSKVAIPNDEILRQLENQDMAVSELGLVWSNELNFVIRDPLTLRAIAPIGAFRAQLAALKELESDLIRLEQQVHRWLGALRPLLACLLSEFTRPPMTASENPPTDSSTRTPFIFD